MIERGRPLYLDDGSHTEMLTLSDGRRLATATFGDEEASPVILFHGTPGTRVGPVPHPDDLRESGIKLVTFDRAGFGRSDRNPGRTARDVVWDVREMVDQLGIDSFGVVGRSGGAKYALGTAALLAERVNRVAVFGAMLPPAYRDENRSSGMSQRNRKFAQRDTVAQITEEDVEELSYRRNLALLDEDVRYFPNNLRSVDQEDVDAVPGLRTVMPLSYNEALGNSLDGWIDDVLSSRMPWDYNFADVTAPVRVYHGSKDHYVPFQNGKILAQMLPNATFMPNLQAHLYSHALLPSALEWLKTGDNSIGQEADPSLHTLTCQLDGFLNQAQDLSRTNLESQSLDVYVRWNTRYLNSRPSQCLDIADINLKIDYPQETDLAYWEAFEQMASSIAQNYGAEYLYISDADDVIRKWAVQREEWTSALPLGSNPEYTESFYKRIS